MHNKQIILSNTSTFIYYCLFFLVFFSPSFTYAIDNPIENVQINSFKKTSVSDIGDLDGDGVSDLAVGDNNVVHILFMNQDGTINDLGPSIIGDDQFGTHVAGIGDLDGDGVVDLAVTSREDDDGFTNAGAIYILFLNENGSVKISQKISTIQGGMEGVLKYNENFGTSISNIGDLDGDGVSDLAVGSHYPYTDENTGVNWTGGRVYLLKMNIDGTVKNYSVIDSADVNGGQRLQSTGFGISVTGMGDLNGDGVIDIAVGASSDGVAGYKVGAVYTIFLNQDGLVIGSQKIGKNLGGFGDELDQYDHFGSAVANIGDLDGDGVNDLLVGAFGDGWFTEKRGAIWVAFLNQSGAVKQRHYISDEDLGFVMPENSWFGYGIASIADIDGDGINEAVTVSRQSNAALYILFFSNLIENNPPVLSPVGNKTVNESQNLTFTISATDLDGDNLIYSATNTPQGSTFDPLTGEFSWTPDYNAAGNYPDIEFAVMDDGSPMELDMEVITITVGNVNRAPVFTNLGPQTVLEGELLSLTLSATDPDGDLVTLSASNTLSGSTFDPATGIFTWTPSLSDEGVYTATFLATDDGSPNEQAVSNIVITVGDNPTPTEQAEDLVETVINFDLPNNIENSYLANLHKVEQFILNGKINPAINQLNAFVNKVEQDYQQSQLTIGQYDSLISAADNLIKDLNNY